ncbi:MAG: 23S rRNA (uracil(1939)-C(5))-methyltransferase RlmD [Bacteroidetes bacterium]|nr:23S rRNA (uracil(1939)-C(5))-methyltransferase RlmD [Bacteroidota bacterium]
MFSRGQIVALEITDYAFGGKGIAKIQTMDGNFIVFVGNTFPGQLVSAKITTKRKKHAEASLIEVLKRSEFETETQYQEISGGPYIRIPIRKQAEYKQKSTLDTFSRLSGIGNIDSVFDTFIESPDTYFYRNKMEYSFSSIEHLPETGQELDDAFALGFKRRGTWWKVENLNKTSGLFDEEWESKLYLIREFLKKTNLPAWHPPKKTGFFRHIVVRKSFSQDRLLINLVTSSEGIENFDPRAFVEFILSQMGDRIAGIQHTINDNVADRAKIENGENKLIYGDPIVTENLLGLSFEISMESFFQTNPKCAELLYTKALDYVFEEYIPENKVVLDLFCGTGTIGQLAAKRAGGIQLIGVDIIPEAIKDAERNAIVNELSGLEFFAADVGKFLRERPELNGRISSIILDPPRAGIAPKTLQKVIDLGAENIVYISCNPSTQARDADTLVQAGYGLLKFSLADQFPHTGHIESIAKFKKRKS